MSETTAIVRTRRGTAAVPVPLKNCKTCKQSLPLAKFERRLKGAQGVSASCKDCITVRYETGTFGCGRCGRRELPGSAFFRGGSGSAVQQPCKECQSSRKAAAARIARIKRGREPYHLLSAIDAEARTATCRECGPVHIYATGQTRGCGWRCGVRSDALSAIWYDTKAEIVDKYAAARWHQIRDVRGAEMRGTCSLCGDVPVRWNQAGSYFTCSSPARKARDEAAERRRRNLAKYGLTPESFEQMKEQQGGGCAICGDKFGRSAGGARLVVDHDHRCCPGESTCGKCVRALLCSPCNTGLGALRDDPAILLAALDYLRKHAQVREAA